MKTIAAKKKRKQKPWLGHLATLGLDGATISIPFLTVSEANQREHPMAKHRRKKLQQQIVTQCLNAAVPLRRDEVVRVNICRMGGRKMDETDNLPASAKHVIDAIAKWLGIDDRDDSVKYAVEQAPRYPQRGMQLYLTYGKRTR